MSDTAKKLQAKRISESFIDREPRVMLPGLEELWISHGKPGYKTFGRIAVQAGYPEKNYFYTIKIFKESQ